LSCRTNSTEEMFSDGELILVLLFVSWVDPGKTSFCALAVLAR
jgi:hypothetical protein